MDLGAKSFRINISKSDLLTTTGATLMQFFEIVILIYAVLNWFLVSHREIHLDNDCDFVIVVVVVAHFAQNQFGVVVIMIVA